MWLLLEMRSTLLTLNAAEILMGFYVFSWLHINPDREWGTCWKAKRITKVVEKLDCYGCRHLRSIEQRIYQRDQPFTVFQEWSLQEKTLVFHKWHELSLVFQNSVLKEKDICYDNGYLNRSAKASLDICIIYVRYWEKSKCGYGSISKDNLACYCFGRIDYLAECSPLSVFNP